MCAEDNRQRIVIERLVGAFKTIAAFAMPGCGAKINVFFDRVGAVPIGAWMWASGIGILEITGFNPITGEIELKNNCPDPICAGQVQSPPGTPIPACTVFMLMAPTCTTSSGQNSNPFPFLNAGFTAPPAAPAVGSCINIAVTNVNGISVGKNITILTGTYYVSSINSATNITICNQGAGLTPGVIVDSTDSAGNLIVPVIVIDTNPCLTDPVLSGQLMVCKNNVLGPIVGTENGQIPVYDSYTDEVNFRTLGIPTLDCTPLTVCLTLDPDLPVDTAYLVTVADTSAFAEGDLVTISGTEFTVDSISDATHMRIVPLSPPDAIQTYNAGAVLCSADCCTVLNVEIDELINNQSNWGGISGGDENDITINISPRVTSYEAGLLVSFIAANTNTGAMTLDVNGLGQKDLETSGGGGPAGAGTVSASRIVHAIYNGTGFVIINSYDSGTDQAVLKNIGISMTTWTPVVTINAGSVSALTIQQAPVIYMNPQFTTEASYLIFSLAIKFTLSGTGGGSTQISVSAPTTVLNTGAAHFPCYIIDAGAPITDGGLWNSDGTSINIFQVGGGAWGNGDTEVNITCGILRLP